ncbi:MAG: bifunctional riboflavin kinase/FAD synthetase [Deltaproteobacteria bacterium]|nr:bifunctional riboflavin kinase/FAD synthetase [Deltaproteobacteria bacterium]
MQIFRHIEHRSLSISNPVLTLGNFDGIHLGHQALLRRVVQQAKAEGGQSLVLTFEPHPLKILAPERAPRLILTHKDKLRLLQTFGVDVAIVQTFDPTFANVEAEEFVRRYLVDALKVHKLWVGRDLRFGKGRKGRVEDLIRWSTEAGFEVGIVDPIELGGVRVSSSRVRTLIERGQVDEARRFLGRCHFVSGRVVLGQRRGRQLGFPTANILPRTEVVPPAGIYATFLQVRERQWPSATSIGVNPTFGDGPLTIESYIFDFQGDLYGQAVRLYFVKRIREEKKFASPELLIEQMRIDVSTAQSILREVDPAESLREAK